MEGAGNWSGILPSRGQLAGVSVCLSAPHLAAFMLLSCWPQWPASPTLIAWMRNMAHATLPERGGNHPDGGVIHREAQSLLCFLNMGVCGHLANAALDSLQQTYHMGILISL